MSRFILDQELENGCVDCLGYDKTLNKCNLVSWTFEKKEGRQVNCPLTAYTHSSLIDKHTVEVMRNSQWHL